MPAFLDFTGRQVGHWTVLGRAFEAGSPIKWNCKCICGAERQVRSAHLSSGSSSSCGCQQERPTKHGQAREGEFSDKYKTWRTVKSRCNHESHPSSEYYHGKLCDSWQDYRNFDRDVPDAPEPGLTIERLDNSKGYEPGNVRWATVTEQHRNQTNCVWLEHDGKRQLLTDWARELGLHPSSLSERIAKYGVAVALSTPKGGKLK